MKNIFALVALAGVALTACSDDEPTNPGTTDSYLVKKKGSYYVYQNVDSVDEGSPEMSEDSVVVGNSVTKDGKTATEYISYRDGAATDTMYYAEEGGKIYLYFQLPTEMFAAEGIGGINLGAQWILVADQSASSWTALSDTIPPFDMQYGGNTFPNTSGGVKILASKTGAETVTVNGQSIQTITYKQDFTLTIHTMFTTPQGSVPLSIPVKFSTRLWMGKNVGLVKEVQDPGSVDTGVFGVVPIQGSSSTLVRYSIAP